MLSLLLLLLACLPKPTEKPSMLYQWRVDRAALPATTLRALHVARTHGNEALVVAGGDDRALVAPVTVYVLEHPTAGLVLIDAGFGRRTAADPADYPGRATARALKLEMGSPAADRLPDIGYTAADVGHIVLTHLHADHAGGVEDFPGAALHLTAEEWTSGQRRSLLHNLHPSAYADHADVRTHDLGDGPYGPFDAHEDLFGDGSVVLLPAPGHTPGHIAVLVNLRGGSYLFTGDAAWVDKNWQQPAPKGWASRTFVETDWKRGMDALWRIRDWSQRAPDLTVISGHDPANLDLRAWPEPYR